MGTPSLVVSAVVAGAALLYSPPLPPECRPMKHVATSVHDGATHYTYRSLDGTVADSVVPLGQEAYYVAPAPCEMPGRRGSVVRRVGQ